MKPPSLGASPLLVRLSYCFFAQQLETPLPVEASRTGASVSVAAVFIGQSGVPRSGQSSMLVRATPVVALLTNGHCGVPFQGQSAMLASSALAVIEAFMGHSGESLRGQQLAPLWAAAATVMKMATKAMRMLFILCCVLYV